MLSFVMAGLVPAIHVLVALYRKTWMPGTSPGMTSEIEVPPAQPAQPIHSVEASSSSAATEIAGEGGSRKAEWQRGQSSARDFPLVMPGLVPGIHVFSSTCRDGVNGRVKPGHDETIENPYGSGANFRLPAGFRVCASKVRISVVPFTSSISTSLSPATAVA